MLLILLILFDREDFLVAGHKLHDVNIGQVMNVKLDKSFKHSVAFKKYDPSEYDPDRKAAFCKALGEFNIGIDEYLNALQPSTGATRVITEGEVILDKKRKRGEEAASEEPLSKKSNTGANGSSNVSRGNGRGGSNKDSRDGGAGTSGMKLGSLVGASSNSVNSSVQVTPDTFREVRAITSTIRRNPRQISAFENTIFFVNPNFLLL